MEARRDENFYITTQQPQPPFFSFGGGGSCAVTTGGLHLGVKAAGGGSCTLGIGLYPVPVLGDIGSGLLDDESGQVPFPSVSGFSDFSCGCSSFGGSSVFSLLSLLLFEGGASVAIANGANPRSYVVGVLPSFSHCCCIIWRACVGMICWSGGRRGSGLYMVANHGGSPSGRFTAVVGRVSPLAVGLVPLAVDAVRDLVVFLDVAGAEVLRLVDP